jgi:hypothetical protein
MSHDNILKSLYPKGFGYMSINDNKINIIQSPEYKHPNFKLIKYDEFKLLINYDCFGCDVYVDNVYNTYLTDKIDQYGGNLAPIDFYGFTHRSINYFAVFNYSGGNNTPIYFYTITKVNNEFSITKRSRISGILVDDQFERHRNDDSDCDCDENIVDISYYFQFEVIDNEIAANVFFIGDHEYLIANCLQITFDEKCKVHSQFVKHAKLVGTFVQNSYCENRCIHEECPHSKQHESFNSCDLFNICTTDGFTKIRYAKQKIEKHADDKKKKRKKPQHAPINDVMNFLVLSEITGQKILSEYSFDINKNILVTGYNIQECGKILAILKLPIIDCKYLTVFAIINLKTLQCKIEEILDPLMCIRNIISQ